MTRNDRTVKPYPVTAYSACNGMGRTLAEIGDALASSKRGLRPCPFEVPFETVTGAVPGELSPPPSRLAAYDSRTVRVALLGYEPIAAAVDQAVRRWGANRIAMILGTSTGGILETERAHDHWWSTGELPTDGYDYKRQHPFDAFTKVLIHLAPIEGPRYVVSTACSSSAKVLSSAQRLLDTDVIDAALVGGVDSLCFTTLRGFHSLGVLASEPCRPFGAERRGMNIGEGAAFALLEREGKGPLVAGVGESSDAFHMSAPEPEGRGALRAMRQALRQAGRSPHEVEYINAHGTGTARNDIAEAKALAFLFGDGVPVASTKGYTGHTLGACGAMEAVFAILATEQHWIPASVGAQPLDAEMPPLHVVSKPTPSPCRVVLTNSFAFGGNNCSVLVERPS